MNRIKVDILGAFGASGIKTETNTKPQNIKNLFIILSAKNPKRGCSIEEQICEILIITAAIAIVNPSFEAINGIIGLRKPVYISQTRCAAHNHIIAFFVFNVKRIISIRIFFVNINKNFLK